MSISGIVGAGKVKSGTVVGRLVGAESAVAAPAVEDGSVAEFGVFGGFFCEAGLFETKNITAPLMNSTTASAVMMIPIVADALYLFFGVCLFLACFMFLPL